MDAPKNKIANHTGGQQEIDLNLSPNDSYNCENSEEISLPQSFSQIRASAANNPAFKRAIEIIRSDIHSKLEDTSKIYVLESTPYTTKEGNSIVMPPKPTKKRKATTPMFVPTPSTMTKKKGESSMKEGKSIVFPESNGAKPLKKVKNSHKVVILMDTRSLLRIMPSVTTSGGIINGKLTKGFLYSFGQKKQISIVCMCHGKFFTAAEFVKHGGGKEVDNPMKFIEVVDDA